MSSFTLGRPVECGLQTPRASGPQRQSPSRATKPNNGLATNYERLAQASLLRGSNKKAADHSAAQRELESGDLAAQADADGRVGSIKTTRLGVSGIKAIVQRTEEKVRSIADTHFCIGIAEGHTGEAPEIGHDS